MHNKQDRRTRILPPAAVLLALLAAGSLLFAFWGERLLRELYPRRYSDYVEYYAAKYEMDPLLVYAFIRTESNFSAKARSDADARGLMQITEVTFDWIRGNIAPTEPLTFEDLYDAETNIRFGTYFLKYCLDRYGGDLPTAAAAYHSGVGTVDGLLADARYSADGTALTDFPYPQMRNYVHKITASYARYQRLYPHTDQAQTGA